MIHIQHLETDITQACQLSCVACNHHVPLWRKVKGGPWATTPEQVEKDLGHFTKVAHAEIWGALGGEPLLHAQLVDILKVVRRSGVADRLEVWTNGIALWKMRDDFWRSFDTLVLSRYADKLSDETMLLVDARCKEFNVTLRVNDERLHPNFKTLYESQPTDADATRAKFAGCFFRHFSRVLNFGYFFTCCCAPHMPMLIQGRPYGSDGVPVAGLTEGVLQAYLERTEPLGACTICAGRDTAVDVKWSEERNPLIWVQKSGTHVGSEGVRI